MKAILSFWFDELSPKDWFEADKDRQKWIDEEVKRRFLSDYDAAMQGERNNWQEHPEGCLALCLLLDQFPRHMFRGTPKAFASDFYALSIAKGAIDRGFDETLSIVQRVFLYLPFEHSENIIDQARSVAKFRELKNGNYLEYALLHLEAINTYTRFPHRNKILGRISTPSEQDYLSAGGGF